MSKSRRSNRDRGNTATVGRAEDQQPRTPASGSEVSRSTRRPAAAGNTGLARCWQIAALIVLLTLIVFGRTATFSFVDWDDDKHILQDQWMYPHPDIGHFWAHAYENLYIPVTYTFWALLEPAADTGKPQPIPGFAKDITLDPHVFHDATLILHCINVILVFFLIRRLLMVGRAGDDRGTARDVAAAAGALLFALHPLQVESVSWISETRGTLSTLLGLLAMFAYWEAAAPDRRILWYVASTILFTAALLAKPAIVILPLLLFVLDLLVLKQPLRQTAPILIAWLVIAAVIVMATQSAQPVAADVRSMQPYGLMVAADALGFYIVKLIAPLNLAVDYARTPMWLVKQPWAAFELLTLIAIGFLIWWFWKRQPVLSAGVCLFVLALLPVLGLVPFTYQSYSTVADRYAYLALVGPGLILALVLARFPRPPAYAATAVALIALAGVSIHQSAYWRDSYALFGHAVAVTPQSYVSLNNLATAEEKDGNHDKAIALYQQSLAIKPWEDAYVNLGTVYNTLMQAPGTTPGTRQTYADDAESAFKSALQLDDNDVEAHNSLAATYGMTDRLDDSRNELEKALRINPDLESADSNLAYTDVRMGDYQGAVDAGTKAVRMDAADANAQYCLYQAYNKLGQTSDAQDHLAMAERRAPDEIKQRLAQDSAPAFAPAPASNDPATMAFNQGAAADGANDLAGAVIAYRKALNIRPDYPEALANIGLDLGKQGQLGEAEADLARAVDLNPNLPGARANLAVAYYQDHKTSQAVDVYNQWIKDDPNSDEAHLGLAIVLVQQGNKAEAIANLMTALQINPGNEQAKKELQALQSGG